jgi:outer membrane protein OmpA-like peptidoglycan-associated protein
MMSKRFLVLGLGSILLSFGCLSVPKELVDARDAYAHASSGTAPQLAPTELRLAREALNRAEDSYKQKPDSYITRDLAYVAQRAAQVAEVKASAAAEASKANQAIKEYQSTQSEIIRSERDRLAAEQQKLAEEQRKLAEEQEKVNQLQIELEKLGSVVREARGMVLTISGSVLFASGQSMILPTAQERLNQVAEALMINKDRKLTVEGHTDSQGSHAYNQALSQRRAESVKNYLVSQGYPAELIAAQGQGEDHPIASNDTAEGRANNRRVEIIIGPKSDS